MGKFRYGCGSDYTANFIVLTKYFHLLYYPDYVQFNSSVDSWLYRILKQRWSFEHWVLIINRHLCYKLQSILLKCQYGFNGLLQYFLSCLVYIIKIIVLFVLSKSEWKCEAITKTFCQIPAIIWNLYYFH